jgi:hypothetical protein
VNRYFDLPELQYDAYGRQSLGRLPTDRPNTFKGFASYRFNWKKSEVEVGGSQFVYQGTPVSTRLEEHVGQGGGDIYAEGRGDMGRTPWFTQTDLLVNHRYRLTERVSLNFSLNVLNLFDERNVTDIYPFLTKPGQIVQYGDPGDVTDGAYLRSFTEFLNSKGDYRRRIEEQGLELDPRYGQPRLFQAPRQARLSFGIQF